MKITLLHFGDLCYPYIIINHILRIKDKTLFELGHFPFNSNVHILSEEKFSNIVEKKYLEGIKDFKSIYKKYSHGNNVKNTHYGITLNHDFDVKNNVIYNYDFIKNSFNIKANNFYNSVTSSYIIFINFTENIKELQISKLEEIMKKKYKTSNFRILIFTKSKDIIDNTKHAVIIQLQNDYIKEWEKPISERFIIFKEIYDKFCYHTKDLHKYPLFEDTIYYKENK